MTYLSLTGMKTLWVKENLLVTIIFSKCFFHMVVLKSGSFGKKKNDWLVIVQNMHPFASIDLKEYGIPVYQKVFFSSSFLLLYFRLHQFSVFSCKTEAEPF